MPHFIRFAVAFCLSLFGSVWPASAGPVQTEQVEAELVAEYDAIRPGTPITLGLRMKMLEHWHVYWRNPGDAGLPTTIEWTLPEGFSVGDIQWPHPEAIELGGLVNYGYEGEVFLLVELTPPERLAEGAPVSIKARADWLVCKESCLPGGADLELSLPVSADPKPGPWAGAIGSARLALPMTDQALSARVQANAETLALSVVLPEGFDRSLEGVAFFPYDEMVIAYAAPQLAEVSDGVLRLTLRRDAASEESPASLSGILVNPQGWDGGGVRKALEIRAAAGDLPARSAAPAGPGLALRMVLGAFLGGLLLNLMPCVFPVISLKILGFVKQAGEDPGRIWRHGLLFAAGVLVSFWMLAGLLLALRAGGANLGWGFQLSSPGFLVAMIGLFTLFGLSLFGVFELGVSLTGVGAGAAERGDAKGSFFSGMLATVVATPCTAPMMGPALFFAFTQPIALAILVFTALGLGMAAPYLLLSRYPALLKRIPRPGPWMESLRQFMGFLLLATAVWLATVLGDVRGESALHGMLYGMVAMGLGAWIFGRWAALHRAAATRRAATLLALLLVAAGAWLGLREGPPVWRAYDAEEVAALVDRGEPVFIDFTASWCLTCQANKKLVLNTEAVQREFARRRVHLIQADWTTYDRSIGQALAAFGRTSVPLYVLYPGPGKDPLVLPELLTAGIVKEALESVTR